MSASQGFLSYSVPVKLSLWESSLGRRQFDSFKGLLSPNFIVTDLLLYK